MNIWSEEQQIQSFDHVTTVLANEERFKLRLGVGRNAFGSIKAGDLIGQITQVGSAAGAGAGAAFAVTAPSTLWAAFTVSAGFASNPFGWIVGAAAASGGIYYGVSRLFKTYSTSRVDEIPKFLNTGLDVLASTTLDLLGSLALKVAAVDGQIDDSERCAMAAYFVEEWGYDPDYVRQALGVLEQNIEKSRLSEMAAALANFSRQNPDCNLQSIQAELRKLLIEIAEADGRLDEREEMAIERIESALQQKDSVFYSTGQSLLGMGSGIGRAASSTARTVGASTTTAFSGATDMASRSRKAAMTFIGAKIKPRD